MKTVQKRAQYLYNIIIMRIREIIKSGITPKIELFQSFLNNFGRNILDVYFHPYFIIYNIRNIYI